MEDVLDLYGEPYDPRRPTVCFDETSTQLIAERRIPIPAHRGRRERFDYEYRRNGTRNLFMLCEPLRGWRHVAVTEQRRMEDFAYQMRWLVDEAYTKAERIRVVLGQPQYPPACIVVPNLCPGGGKEDTEALGVPLHPKAWQLAEHGRDRAERAESPVPRKANPRRGDAASGGRGPRAPAQ